MRVTPLRADGILIFTAVIWGVGFVPQQLAMADMPPLAFTSVRFAVGVLCLLPLVWLTASGQAGAPWPWRAGILTGLALALGSALQQLGLQTTTVSNAGFITGLYVVFVPMFGIFIGRRARAAQWLGVLMAVGGLYLLTVSESMRMGAGDLWVLAGAACWGIQIIIIEHVAASMGSMGSTLRLAISQFVFTAVATGAIALIIEQPSTAQVMAARWSVLYCGVLSVAGAFTLQIVAQRAAPAAHAAIIFSLEAVFAALAGRIWLNEDLSARELTGCAVIFAGIVCAQLDRIVIRPRSGLPIAGNLS